MEKRDLYNRKRKKTKEVIKVTEEIPKDKYILVELVLIQNSKGQILVQKRSKQKGGKYGLTSGHAKSGENSIQGIITEIKEELGIQVKPQELQLIHSEKIDKNKCFYDLYYLQKDYNISEMNLQKEEVEYVKWCSKEEVAKMCSKDTFKKEHIEAYEIIMNKIKEKKVKMCQQ